MDNAERILFDTTWKCLRPRITRAAVLGVAGCGKSTLLRAMAGLSGPVSLATPGMEGRHRVVLDGGQVELVERASRPTDCDLILNVVDAADLAPSLALTLPLLAETSRVVVLVNKMDRAESRGLWVDVYGLSLELGVPAIPVVAVDGESVRRAVVDIDCLYEIMNSGRIRHPLDGAACAGSWKARAGAVCARVVRCGERASAMRC